MRLRCAYYITCTSVEKDADGNIVALHCTYDPESRGGGTPDNRRVKGTLHWVSIPHAQPIEVRLYDHLFTKDNPEESGNFLDCINPDSLQVVTGYTDASTVATPLEEVIQFERLGYFTPDKSSTPERPVFNRTATLRDTWAKIEKKL